jgi:HD-like signal output (HDOD) protein
MPVTAPPPLAADEAKLTLEYLLRRMKFKSDFPALSGSVTRIQAISESERENMNTLCDGILQDVALTQKLLRLVNTAHFRRAGADPISTVSRAVALIGMGGVRNLALSLMLLEHMQDKVHAQQLKVEFLRTIMAGTLASELCQSGHDGETAYMGALFRNLGRLLVFYYLPDDAVQIMSISEQSGAPQSAVAIERASREVLGMGLDQLGVSVGRMWGLPENLVECMSDPGAMVPGRSLAARPERLWWLASLANRTAEAMLDAEPAELGTALSKLSSTYQRALELGPDELQDAAGRARHRLSELVEALNFHVPAHSPGERLLETYYIDTPHADGDDEADEHGAQLIDPPQPASQPLASAAALAAPAPDNSAAELARHTATKLTSGIQEITNILVDSFQLTDVLRVILETMLLALDCRRVVFCLRDPRSATLLARLALGADCDQIKTVFKVPLVAPVKGDPDLFTAVCLKNIDTLIADASAPTIVQRLPAWFRNHVQAPTFLLLPLVMKRPGQPDMVLGLIYADKGNANSLVLDANNLSLLRTLRNQAVMAFKQRSGAS